MEPMLWWRIPTIQQRDRASTSADGIGSLPLSLVHFWTHQSHTSLSLKIYDNSKPCLQQGISKRKKTTFFSVLSDYSDCCGKSSSLLIFFPNEANSVILIKLERGPARSRSVATVHCTPPKKDLEVGPTMKEFLNAQNPSQISNSQLHAKNSQRP